MKTIICDECVPKRLMHKLTANGFAILRPPASEPDGEILAYAKHNDYPIITYDHDFANYRKSVVLQYGVGDASCVKHIKKVCKKFEKMK